MTDKEKFDTARELIRHEDGLLNNRGTWFLVLQGFLFTAFVSGVPLLGKFNGKHVFAISAGLVLIGVVGIYSGITVLNECWIAFRQIKKVQEWWERTRTESKDNFPPLSGGYDHWCAFIFSSGAMSIVLALVWMLLIALLIGGVILGG